jgi:hypothetical protein
MSDDLRSVPTASPESARAFVAALELPAATLVEAMQGLPMAPALPPLRTPLGPLFGLRGRGAAALEDAQGGASVGITASGTDPVGLNIKAGQDQSFLVGSQLLSFNREVTDDRRAAAVNSCLLAQLRASKLYPNPNTPEAARQWHASYVNTLTNLGWVIKAGTTATQTTGADGASVDKVLLDVVGALLGGGMALTLATKVIQKLADARKDDPLITLYESRVVEQNVVEFGAGLASGADAGFELSVVECAVDVQSTQYQVLFFKWSADSASAEGRRFDLSLSDSVYAAAKPLLEAKILPFVSAYVAALDI